jgi:hypothetical protein
MGWLAAGAVAAVEIGVGSLTLWSVASEDDVAAVAA